MVNAAVAENPKVLTRNSVTKHDDIDQSMYFIMPSMFMSPDHKLDSYLPEHRVDDHFSARDMLLLSLPRIESGWGIALKKTGAKIAAQSWDVVDNRPHIKSQLTQILNHAGAGMGMTGWAKYQAAQWWSYASLDLAISEVVRASRARGSKTIGINHLNPLRCRLTGDLERPVEYCGDDGSYRLLYWHDVVMISGMPDPTGGMVGLNLSAAEAAYKTIVRRVSAEWYQMEKMRGQRPLALYFLQGAVPDTVKNAIADAEMDAKGKKGAFTYMGAVVKTIMGDAPANLIKIPLAELPDHYNEKEERQAADLRYANALGADPQDLDPSLIASGSLGTGTQSELLSEKEKGNAMAVFRQQMATEYSRPHVLKGATFFFAERDLRDEKMRAEVDERHLKNADAVGARFGEEAARQYLLSKKVIPEDYMKYQPEEEPEMDGEEKEEEKKEKEKE